MTGQGGGGAALASAQNLDMRLNSYFQASKDEKCYGPVRLQPLVYMDDTARASHSVISMRAGNLKLAALMTEKQLDNHPTKSGFLLFGTETFKSASRMEAKNSPNMLGKINMKEKESGHLWKGPALPPFFRPRCQPAGSAGTSWDEVESLGSKDSTDSGHPETRGWRTSQRCP